MINMNIQRSLKRKISDKNKENLPLESPIKKSKNPHQKVKHQCSDSSSSSSDSLISTLDSSTSQLEDEVFDDDEEDDDACSDDYTDTNESLTDNSENNDLVLALHRLLRDANVAGSDSICK
jgi:hypothetical protein